MKRTTLALLCLVLTAPALAATGCGEKTENTSAPKTQKLDLILDFFPNADHVGIYAAIADREFAKVGLEVTPRAPSDPAAPLKLLAAGKADLVISYEPEVFLARDKGLDVVAVGAVVQKPLTSIIAVPPSPVRSAAGLRDRRVGTAGIPYQSAYLKTILERARVNPATVSEINVGFNLVPALLSKKVDATLGGFWNYEGVQLAQLKRRPVVIPVDRAGVPTYNELVVVARRSDLKSDPGKVRRFMRALSAGYERVRDDPARATGQLVAANRDLDPRLQLASVKATLPVFFPTSTKRPFGYQDAREWVAYGAWMLRNDLIKRSPSATRAFSNEFLPGQGL